MTDFELWGLTTPEHEMERWRDVAVSAIQGHLRNYRTPHRVPRDVVLAFEHGRTLEVYLDTPRVEGSVVPNRNELLGETTEDFHKAALRGFGITGEI